MVNNSEKRQIFSAGEVLTLLGMFFVVIGAALVWSRTTAALPPTVPAIYVTHTAHVQAGFDLHIGWLKLGWLIVFAGTACGAMLIFNPSAREKRLFLGVHIGLSAVIFAVALLHIGPYPGSILATVGSMVLTVGGILRYK